MPEFAELVGGYVGDGAHLHAGFAPVGPVIAELGTGERLGIGAPWWARRRRLIDACGARRRARRQCGRGRRRAGRPAMEILRSQNRGPAERSPASRRTTALRCADRLTEHLEMSGLQRAQMRVHDGRRQSSFGVISAQEREQTPAEKHGKEKRGGYGEPAPRSGVSNRHNGDACGSAKLRLQLLAQR